MLAYATCTSYMNITTAGLYQTFGSNFHCGKDMAQMNTAVSSKVTVGGIEFNVILEMDCGVSVSVIRSALCVILLLVYRNKICKTILTLAAIHDILYRKSHRICRKVQNGVSLFPMKIFTAPQHT